jgi:hypothetical protein
MGPGAHGTLKRGAGVADCRFMIANLDLASQQSEQSSIGNRQSPILMRLAISGTHCSGKSTLIDAFLLAHQDFALEPEPYQVLTEELGEVFPAQLSAEDFYRQLEYNVSRLSDYQSADAVIFERCPVDFLAYLFALRDLQRDPRATSVIEISMDLVSTGLERLDLIVLLPINQVEADDEDQELREAVDVLLTDLLVSDLGLFTSTHPSVLEVKGSTADRLKMVEQTLESFQGMTQTQAAEPR